MSGKPAAIVGYLHKAPKDKSAFKVSPRPVGFAIDAEQSPNNYFCVLFKQSPLGAARLEYAAKPAQVVHTCL